MTNMQIKVTQIKSKYGRLAKHKACLIGLGIKKIHRSVIVNDTPEIRGMLNKISYMIKIEEI